MGETTNGTVLAVGTANLGDELDADAAAGSTSITITDAADFAESGGTLSINGQLIDYLDCDDETGVMTLVDALVSDAFAGDAVYLADPSGALASELRATVQVVGSLDSDEPIEAIIAHPLVPLLSEGIRDPGTGESVTLELLPGEEWQLVNVHGRKPEFDSDNSNALNVVTGFTGDATTVSIAGTTQGPGSSYAAGSGDVAVGNSANAQGGSSVAVGLQSNATGGSSAAVGLNAHAAGDLSVAIGHDATAYASADVAIGEDSSASGPNAVAIGRDSDASADGAITVGGGAHDANSTSVGTGAVAGGTKSLALGADSGTNGAYAVAVGWSASATAQSAIAVGEETVASGEASIALGGSAVADFATGINARAQGVGSVAIGADHTGSGPTALNDDDFLVGTSNHHVFVAGRLNVAPRTPSGTADTQGAVGDITSDDSFVYVKTSAGWKRAALSTF